MGSPLPQTSLRPLWKTPGWDPRESGRARVLGLQERPRIHVGCLDSRVGHSQCQAWVAYECPPAISTNYPKLGGLQTTGLLFEFWGPEVRNQGVGRATLPSKILGEPSSLLFPVAPGHSSAINHYRTGWGRRKCPQTLLGGEKVGGTTHLGAVCGTGHSWARGFL